jgi:hypothetical protein
MESFFALLQKSVLNRQTWQTRSIRADNRRLVVEVLIKVTVLPIMTHLKPGTSPKIQHIMGRCFG